MGAMGRFADLCYETKSDSLVVTTTAPDALQRDGIKFGLLRQDPSPSLKAAMGTAKECTDKERANGAAYPGMAKRGYKFTPN
jgi:hypothetical protein